MRVPAKSKFGLAIEAFNSLSLTSTVYIYIDYYQ